LKTLATTQDQERRLPVDPQIQTLLDRAAGVPATHTLPLAAARTQAESRVALMAPPAEIAGVREVAIDGPGGQLRLRLYTPRDAGPFPLVVFFHGSGFVLCASSAGGIWRRSRHSGCATRAAPNYASSCCSIR
jgi:acetyl esterase